MTLMESLGSALILEPIIFNNLIVGKLLKKFHMRMAKNIYKKLYQEKRYILYYFLPMQTIKIQF